MHVRGGERAATVCDRLIEQREAIAQRSVGGTREHVDRLVVEDDAFGAQDRLHLAERSAPASGASG